VLLILATVIATYGVLSGSTATVIEAMIVAPLMSPIMATTAALVKGKNHQSDQADSRLAGDCQLCFTMDETQTT
jgi:uncharacterized membrane protein